MKFYVQPVKLYTLTFFTLLTATSLRAQNLHIFASPNGSATGDGSSASAPVSLDQAKAVAKAHPTQACTIYLANGVYKSISLDATDSRSAADPVVYVSSTPHGAVFTPENYLDRTKLQAIPDSIKSRIVDATAKTMVKQIPLSAMGIVDTAQWPAQFGISDLVSPKFYKDGQPLPMSRYPAGVGTMPMRQVVNAGVYKSVPGGSFKYQDDRGKYWLKAINDGGLWLAGNWQAQFQMDVVRTYSISTADSLITQSIGIYGGLGAKPYGRLISGQEPYYALNLVEEIAAEGQWSVNFRTRMLYIWPPATGTLTFAGNSRMPAISVTGVSNTQFINVDVRGGSGNGIELRDCNNVQVDAAHISICSGNGVTITGGSYCTIQSCDIDSVGAGGVIVSSDNFTTDQFNVTLSHHKIINNHIYSYAREAFLYSAAVNTQTAVGVYVAFNKVHDSPQVGILYGGNSNTFEFNDVYDVVKVYSDMGAFYKVDIGELWLSRGNKLNHNYVHDALAANGFYADNFSSGDSTVYCITERVAEGFFNHQGYFQAYANNISVNTQYPATSMVEPVTSPYYATHLNSLRTIWNSSPAYRAAYPECADMVGNGTPNISYWSKIWPSYTGCVYTRNPGIFSNSNIDSLFNRDGTTNSNYARTGPVFTKWNTVFQDNIRLNGGKITPILPFIMDSLLKTGAFNLTQGKDWHLNRIGLHKDQYRTDLTGLTIQGIDPVMKLNYSSSNNLKTPGTVTLTMGIKFPNAANVISATYWLDNGKPITGLYISKKSIAYDSVVYAATWTNPPAGTHTIKVQGNDGDGTFWQYFTNTVSFTISSATVASATDSATHRTANSFNDSTAATAARSADSARAASLDSLSALSLTLYPNPAKSVLNVSYNSGSAQQVDLYIYDMLGRIMQKKTVDMQAGPNTVALPVSGLPTGSYLLTLQAKFSAVNARRFVVQH